MLQITMYVIMNCICECEPCRTIGLNSCGGHEYFQRKQFLHTIVKAIVIL